MRIGAVVQARMSSTRFPGKVLHHIHGKPLLQYVLDSLVRCREIDDVCVATSSGASDDPVAGWCLEQGAACVRGPLDDVAGRFVLACRERNLNAFVRICGDSPLLDWRLVDRAAAMFRRGGCELVSNVCRRTFPKGQSVEVVDAATHERCHASMGSPEDLEHVTRYYHVHPGVCRMESFECGDECGEAQLSVDTPEDMEWFESLVALMDRPHWEYDWKGCLALMERCDGRG